MRYLSGSAGLFLEGGRVLEAVIGWVVEDVWRSVHLGMWFLLAIYVLLWKKKVKRLLGIRFGAWKRMDELYKRVFKVTSKRGR